MIELLLFIQSIFWLAHPHYVSTSEVNYNPGRRYFWNPVSVWLHMILKTRWEKQFKSTVDLGPRVILRLWMRWWNTMSKDSFRYGWMVITSALTTRGYELDKDKVNVYLQSEVISFMPVDIHIENRLLLKNLLNSRTSFDLNIISWKSARLTRSQPIMHIHLESK